MIIVWACPNGHASQVDETRWFVPARWARKIAPRCPLCKAVMVKP